MTTAGYIAVGIVIVGLVVIALIRKHNKNN